MADQSTDPKVKGGIARRDALSPERRSEIARAAANERWNARVLRATHEGTLRIGNIEIPCAVLEDGMRILSENGITEALLGSRSGASKRIKRAARDGGAPVPLFLAPPRLTPFISEEFPDGPPQPLEYMPGQGNRRVLGFDANVLTSACNVWLKAREADALQKQQLDKAQKAEILMRGLAAVGITALVDEATGYQYDRARTALAEILEKFISKELIKWVKTFPDEFYYHVYRLKGWKPGEGSQRTPLLGKITNDLTYERLAPGVLDELQRLTPRDNKGRLKTKLFRRLTEDIGHPKLREHLASEITLMRIFDDGQWEQFYKALGRALPKQVRLPLFDKADGLETNNSD